VSLVVGQTGYPAERVELDADLEADLGIDSIKKAQLFGELAGHLEDQVQIQEGMSLDDFRALRHVMDFLIAQADGGLTASEGSIATAPPPAPPAPAATGFIAPAASKPAPAPAAVVSVPGQPAPAPAGNSINPAELEQFLINFVVEQTGYPAEMVELDADLEADLGIDSIKKAQLFGEMAEHLQIQVQIHEGMSLDDFPTLRHVLDFLANSMQQGAASSAAPLGHAGANGTAPAQAVPAVTPPAVAAPPIAAASPTPVVPPAAAAAPASNGPA